MFGIYAADVEFHHVAEERERALLLQALRRERLVPEPRRTRRAPRPVGAWPRRIALPAHALSHAPA